MVNILIAGDYVPQGRIADFIEKGDYIPIFGQVKTVVEKCDYSIVNLECPVRITPGDGIKKNGPSLKCTPKAVDALKFAGFNCVTLANNHFYDQGEEGVKETIEILDSSGIDYVGGGHNLEDASRTLYKSIKGQSFAFVNCCEHEFSIATDTTGGSNPLNPIQQFYAIEEARKNAEYVIVIVHGGIEHFQYPSPRMVETYRFFIDAGADAVINHHQHCFCGHEIYKDKPVFYGLGNFCFDWNERNTSLWSEGFMVMLNIEGKDINFSLYPYTQNDTVLGVNLKDSERYNDWLSHFKAISEVICNKEILQEKYKELLTRTERFYSSNITPYSNRISRALYMRHLLPMLMSKKQRRKLLNMLMCESHYDRMLQMLHNFSK